VPTISFNHFPVRDRKVQPTIQPTGSLHPLIDFDAERLKVEPLSRRHLVLVLLCVPIHRGFDPLMTERSLYSLGIDLRLADEPRSERVPEVVKSKPLTLFDLDPGSDCGPALVILDEAGRAEWHLSVCLH
jgi:hypothetical protein